MAKRDSRGRFLKGVIQNPNGRRGKARNDSVPEVRGDGWGNIYSGVGTADYDRRTATTFAGDIVSEAQAIELMRGDDIAARLCEKLPRHALRPGFDCLLDMDGDGKKDLQETIEQRWRDLDLDDALERAAIYERSRGGAAVVIGAVDGQDLRKPLEISKVREVTALNVFETRECRPLWYYTDALRPKFRRPAIYQITPLVPGTNEAGVGFTQPFEIHESRLLVFGGIRVSNDIDGYTEYAWGDSVLTRVWRVLRDFNSTWDSVSLIMQDFSQSIFKIKDLHKIVKNDDFETFKNRMKALDMGRSLVRAAILDSEEEFERKATPLTNVADILDRFESRMAAAADMPVTVLFGRSPAGLNATGESDLQLWNENVSDYRERHFVPAIEKLTKCLLAELGQDPEMNFTIQGRPIREESAREQAETRELHAKAMKIYIESGVLYPEEVAESMFGGDTYSPEVMVDWKVRTKLEAEAEKMEQEQAERELEMLKAEGLAAQKNSGAEDLPEGEEE